MPEESKKKERRIYVEETKAAPPPEPVRSSPFRDDRFIHLKIVPASEPKTSPFPKRKPNQPKEKSTKSEG